MKSPLCLLLSLALLLTALATARAQDPAAATVAARYTPGAQRLDSGQYGAEVRRAVLDSDEVAWSSAPYATMAEALREACRMIETVYQPGSPCPAAPVAGANQMAAHTPERGKPPPVATAPKPAANADAKSKIKAPQRSAMSGYQVPGCPFYALVNGKVVQRCPLDGSPGTRPFWSNEDAFEGGYGGWGR